MIELGLSRITRLLSATPLPWRGIHVAGTNGKGSICAYISAVLHSAGVTCGRFTSPHLIDRWDCIAIDNKPVAQSLFRRVEDTVQQRNKKENINASEFELLTATAFEVFSQENVEVGIVEVGMGGRLDATNVLKFPLVTVIAKIGLDHQAFLGNTIEEIAREKAGIIKPGAPCVIDGSNSEAALGSIRSVARAVAAGPLYEVTPNSDLVSAFFRTLSETDLTWHSGLEAHQKQNIACAVAAVQLGLEAMKRKVPFNLLANAITDAQWPGRLQAISISSLANRKKAILLDGAHNPQSAACLGSYVRRRLRSGQSVTWVLAATQGKDLEGILKPLLKPNDTVVAVAFSPVDGMPWIKATAPVDLLRFVQSQYPDIHTVDAGNSIRNALNQAAALSNEGPLVIAGSLYLVSDVLRLLK